jgi:type IV secretory pathway VirB9-like protein
VAEAIKHNQTPTLQHGITVIYPYSPDVAYPLNCQKLHVTQIRLRDDETTSKDNVKIGDRERWGTIVGEHSVLVFPLASTTAITVPGAPVRIPAEPDMVTNLAIQTSAGNNYVFNPVKEIKGTKNFTQAIEFYYPGLVKAQAAARDAAIKAGQQAP